MLYRHTETRAASIQPVDRSTRPELRCTFDKIDLRVCNVLRRISLLYPLCVGCIAACARTGPTNAPYRWYTLIPLNDETVTCLRLGLNLVNDDCPPIASAKP